MNDSANDWQTCKACGRRDYFNFYLPDEIWLSVVPPELANLVVCLPCFDEFAYQKQVNYIPYLKQLLFIGNSTGVDFRAKDDLDRERIVERMASVTLPEDVTEIQQDCNHYYYPRMIGNGYDCIDCGKRITEAEWKEQQ